jgi:large subunit ribosomal protein L17
MRHRKHTFKVGRSSAHRRSLIANMLKSLIENGSITTTVAKAKELRRHADKMVTIVKNGNGSLASRRKIISELRLGEEQSAYKKLVQIADTNKERPGGYTRIVRANDRVGDNAPLCVIQYLNSVPQTA